MPRSCSVCIHPETAQIAKAIAAGGSNRTLADRYGVKVSAVQRHRVNCLRLPRREKDTGASREPSDGGGSVRFDIDAGEARCSACGISGDAADPQALLRRAERLLWLAESIAAKARKDDDARLSLIAVDRARLALEVLMRAHGMLAPDAAVTVNVDQRKLAIATLAALPTDFVERMSKGDRGALEAVLEATEMDAVASGTALARAPVPS